jgi:tRNA threonylcarbamoyladenosine biosynthesis protein TsaB
MAQHPGPVRPGSSRGSDDSKARPILLAIETAGSRCSAAVQRGRDVLAVESRALRHRHAEALLPMVARVTAAAGLSPRQLDVVAAAVGPGGFTGIRAGLAAARGIAVAAAARTVGVNGFDAAAARIKPDAAQPGRLLLVALDSRRADLYVRLFAAAAARREWVPLGAPAAILPERLPEHIAEQVVAAARCLLVAGDAAEVAAAALSNLDTKIVPQSAPDALGVAAAALRQLAAGTAAAVDPLYLRPPDVTLSKRSGPSGA